MTTSINIRIDKEDKENLDETLKAMGLDISTAFRLFATQVIRLRKLPFEIVAKNVEPKSIPALDEAIAEYEKGETTLYPSYEAYRDAHK